MANRLRTLFPLQTLRGAIISCYSIGGEIPKPLGPFSRAWQESNLGPSAGQTCSRPLCHRPPLQQQAGLPRARRVSLLKGGRAFWAETAVVPGHCPSGSGFQQEELAQVKRVVLVRQRWLSAPTPTAKPSLCLLPAAGMDESHLSLEGV